MSYLANENLPQEVINVLKEEGIDIISIRDIKLGAKDEEVIQIANQCKRILLSFDKDFGELIFRKKKKVLEFIFLKFSPRSPEYIAEKLKHILMREEIEYKNHFSVIEETRIRLVPLG